MTVDDVHRDVGSYERAVLHLPDASAVYVEDSLSYRVNVVFDFVYLFLFFCLGCSECALCESGVFEHSLVVLRVYGISEHEVDIALRVFVDVVCASGGVDYNVASYCRLDLVVEHHQRHGARYVELALIGARGTHDRSGDSFGVVVLAREDVQRVHKTDGIFRGYVDIHRVCRVRIVLVLVEVDESLVRLGLLIRLKIGCICYECRKSYSALVIREVDFRLLRVDDDAGTRDLCVVLYVYEDLVVGVDHRECHADSDVGSLGDADSACPYGELCLVLCLDRDPAAVDD